MTTLNRQGKSGKSL